MGRTFRLALAQINLTVGDLGGNTGRMLDYLRRARDGGADLVAFPELATTGYPPEDLLFKRAFIEENLAAMRQVVAASEGLAVALGYVNGGGPRLTNAAAIGLDGRLLDSYDKIFLPNYGVFDEERYFSKGEICPVYEINGVRIGVNVCEDIWYAVGPAAVQQAAGAELIVNLNASPFHAGKSDFRRRMIAERAASHRLFVAYLNTVGGQDELVFDGNSIVCDPAGRTIAGGPAFEEALIITDLVLEDAPASSTPDAAPPPIGTPDERAAVGRPAFFAASGYRERARPPLPAAAPAAVMPEVEEIYRALVTGVRDYLGKTGFARALVGLSGGVDSALTAAVAADALGGGQVVGVTMPSRYSSPGSIADSAALARNLGLELWEVPIEPAHQAFAAMLAGRFRDTPPNVAEENVQARIRGNILMTISNKFGWMALTTGNKSEMAMGYATLYGDMAGGFAVLKDVPKTTVYQLCRWRNDHGALFGGPNGVIPQAIIDKPPSAELKENQLDQDTLPPYEVLDPVIKAYVEDDSSYAEMAAQGFDPAVVRQVMAAVDRNEYKRRQAPPGVKITPRAFGRDWRLPIVNRYHPWR